MNDRTIKKKTLISSIIFIIVLVKDLFANYYELIPVRGRLNILGSWLVILPIFAIAVTLSLQVIKHKIAIRKTSGNTFYDLSFFLSLPIIIYLIVVAINLFLLFT